MKEPISLVIVTCGDQLVMVKNQFGWELPGGKINPGEAPETAAIRELEEETGIHVDSLTHLHTGLHDAGDRNVSYFTLDLSSICFVGPQNPKEITAVKWIKAKDYTTYAHYSLLPPAQAWLDDTAKRKNQPPRDPFGIH